MKTLSKTISLLRNDEQQVVANGYPYLRVNGVPGCPVEGLYMQMLFGPLEEQLNLPTFTVQLSNGQRIFYREVVGQEVIDLGRSKQNKCGNRAPQIHERMHLESSLPMVKLRSGAQFQAQLDGAAIERIYHFFKTNPQLFIFVKRCGSLTKVIAKS